MHQLHTDKVKLNPHPSERTENTLSPLSEVDVSSEMFDRYIKALYGSQPAVRYWKLKKCVRKRRKEDKKNTASSARPPVNELPAERWSVLNQ